MTTSTVVQNAPVQAETSVVGGHAVVSDTADVLCSWPEYVYVDTAGVIEDLTGKVGRLRLKERKVLVGYAGALLSSDRNELRFIWIDETGRWLSVWLEVEHDNRTSPRTRMQAEIVEPAFSLTIRELDVLTLAAAGFSNDVIAARLSISARTIAKHVENIFAKTKTWTRAGVASMATDRSLLRLPTPGGCDGYPLGTGAVERIAQQPLAARRSEPRQLNLRPILIGMPLSLSMRGNADALEMLNGATLAIEQLNERGGINGRELRLLTADADISNATSLAPAYETLIDAEVDAITAGYSLADPAILKLAGDFSGPYLHAATMESVVDCVRNDFSRLGNVFQVCASDINYGLGLLRFLNDLEAKGDLNPRNRRMVVLQPFWPDLNIGLDQIDRGLGNKNWQIEVISDLPRGGVSWDPVLDRLHHLDPSVVVLASYFVEDSIALQKAFMARPIPSLLYKVYSPSIPAYRQELGHLTDGVVWATTTGLYSDRIGHQFKVRYRQRFGRDPGQSHAGIAYDRINILAGAWARAGNSRLFSKVIEDLRSTIHRGVNGSYYFGSEGQVGLAFPDDTQDPSISQAHLVFQIQNGEQRILSPHPYANARFQKPNWLPDQ